MRGLSTTRLFTAKFARQTVAVLGCVMLLYVVSGVAFLHHHSKGPETTCHVCQVLHAPALAYSPGNLIPAAHQIARYSSTLELFNAENFVASHRTPRAPPLA
ncbi:MAG: hypothetical protein JO119_10335 [Acidobacteria bacterium]|nr:hypothetical protein [Acidobacteriota bacterium]